MVHYSIDTEPRSRVHFFAAALALAVSFAVPYVLQDVNARVLVPSAFAVYGLLLFVFNRWLWKVRPFALLAGVPNISGRYRGKVTRDSGPGSVPLDIPVTVAIAQTWLKIEIAFTSAETYSTLTVCGFYVENEVSPRILCSYIVKQKMSKADSNNYGEGSQEFHIDLKGKTTLSGHYYSTKGRGGFISIERTDA